MTIVSPAPGIEVRAANRASVSAIHVFADAQLRSANAAQYRLLLPLRLWPNFDWMVSQRRVTVLARVIHPATLHLDGDNVAWTVIMRATRLGIEVHAADFWNVARNNFGFSF